MSQSCVSLVVAGVLESAVVIAFLQVSGASIRTSKWVFRKPLVDKHLVFVSMLGGRRHINSAAGCSEMSTDAATSWRIISTDCCLARISLHCLV